jgi:mRNA interferase HigB
MRVIKRKVLKNFAEKHPRASGPLNVWYKQIKAGEWDRPSDLKQVFGSNVDFTVNHRAIFNIKGNEDRLITEINYKTQGDIHSFHRAS